MKPPLYSSLLAKFLLASVLPLFLLLVFANAVYIYLKTEELRERHLADVTDEVELLARQLSIPVWQFDKDTVNTLVRTLEGLPYIVCVRLDEYENYSETVRQSSQVGDCRPEMVAFIEDRHFIRAAITYEYDDQLVQIGMLETVLDLGQVGEPLFEALLSEFVLLVLYAAIFMVGFTVALKATVLKPLQRVRSSIQSYQVSGERIPVKWKSKDELGQLIEEYNKNLIQMEEAEQELVDKNMVLEEARYEAEMARDNAEKTAKAKSDFLANMSHEIRTPMNAIQGLAEMLSRTRLDVKQGGYLHRIRNSADILLAIINDILDFSKIEAGKLELESVEFSLAELIEKVADVESFTAATKGLEIIVRISPDIPDRLKGDAMRLSQVLINLISNAIKFTESGEVVVTLTLADCINDKVVVRGVVADTGVGIADTALPMLFDSFTQADGSTTRRYGGTGLGLTICKRLVKLMNGDISVKSQLGSGSEFTFTAEFCAVPGVMPENPLLVFNNAFPDVVIVGDSYSCDELYAILNAFDLTIYRIRSGKAAINRIRSLAALEFKPHNPVVVYVDIGSVRVSLSELTEQVDRLGTLTPYRLVPLLSIRQRDEVEAGVDNPYIAALLTKPVLKRRALNSLLEAMGYGESRQYRETAPLAVDSNLRGARILVVEDNQVNQLVAREMLESAGVIVRVADNGRQALTRLEDKSITYDAVLMDIHMPEMDGYDAAKVIRKRYGKRLPIIALTANATVEEKKRCLAIGMNDFLTKPIDNASLAHVLAHWVGVNRDGEIPAGAGPDLSDDQPAPRVTCGEFNVAASDRPGAAIEGVISIADLKLRFKSHPTIIPRILESFEASFGDFETEFMAAAEASDSETMHRLAHSLKGSAANIAAERLRELAAELEEKLESDRRIEAMEWFPWVVDHLSKVLTFIGNYLKDEAI